MRRLSYWWQILVIAAWKWLILGILAILVFSPTSFDIIPVSNQLKIQIRELIPDWPGYIWIILLFVIYALMILESAYRVYKKVERIKADKSLVITPLSYSIGPTGMPGYPKEPDQAYWLCLEVFVNPIDKPIDSIELLIDGVEIPASNWPGIYVAAFNACFNITEWRWKGQNQIELIANVGKDKFSSGKVTIDFDIEPGTIGHRI